MSAEPGVRGNRHKEENLRREGDAPEEPQFNRTSDEMGLDGSLALSV
jgi:hypothetical protein